MDVVLAGPHLPSTAASPGARREELDSQHPRNPKPTMTPASVLTVLRGAPAAPGGRRPVCPGSAALPVARAAPRQSHLMERGSIQDPAEREVGHPLEVPGKGREMSAPTPGPDPRDFIYVCAGCLTPARVFAQRASCPTVGNASV